MFVVKTQHKANCEDNSATREDQANEGHTAGETVKHYRKGVDHQGFSRSNSKAATLEEKKEKDEAARAGQTGQKKLLPGMLTLTRWSTEREGQWCGRGTH